MVICDSRAILRNMNHVAPAEQEEEHRSYALIVACETQTGGIGLDGKLPWHIPGDLARFRRLTQGGTVLMGRRTWESLPEHLRPLPNRSNIVISGVLRAQQEEGNETAFVAASSLQEGLDIAWRTTPIGRPIFVIGGQRVFEAAVRDPCCTRAFVTFVTYESEHLEHLPKFDSFFPSWNLSDERVWVRRTAGAADDGVLVDLDGNASDGTPVVGHCVTFERVVVASY